MTEASGRSVCRADSKPDRCPDPGRSKAGHRNSTSHPGIPRQECSRCPRCSSDRRSRTGEVCAGSDGRKPAPGRSTCCCNRKPRGNRHRRRASCPDNRSSTCHRYRLRWESSNDRRWGRRCCYRRRQNRRSTPPWSNPELAVSHRRRRSNRHSTGPGTSHGTHRRHNSRSDKPGCTPRSDSGRRPDPGRNLLRYRSSSPPYNDIFRCGSVSRDSTLHRDRI